MYRAIPMIRKLLFEFNMNKIKTATLIPSAANRMESKREIYLQRIPPG